MALVADKMKKEIEAILFTALQREFKETSINKQAIDYHRKLAAAISDVALIIVKAITTEAMVVPGAPVATAGSPTNQAGTVTGPTTIK